MAGKEFREVRKRLGNEPADSSPYVGYARAMLGELKEDMARNGLQQGVRRRSVDGVQVEVSSIFGQDEIRIIPPPGEPVQEPTQKGVRPVLPALWVGLRYLGGGTDLWGGVLVTPTLVIFEPSFADDDPSKGVLIRPAYVQGDGITPYATDLWSGGNIWRSEKNIHLISNSSVGDTDGNTAGYDHKDPTAQWDSIAIWDPVDEFNFENKAKPIPGTVCVMVCVEGDECYARYGELESRYLLEVRAGVGVDYQEWSKEITVAGMSRYTAELLPYGDHYDVGAITCGDDPIPYSGDNPHWLNYWDDAVMVDCFIQYVEEDQHVKLIKPANNQENYRGFSPGTAIQEWRDRCPLYRIHVGYGYHHKRSSTETTYTDLDGRVDWYRWEGYGATDPDPVTASDVVAFTTATSGFVFTIKWDYALQNYPGALPIGESLWKADWLTHTPWTGELDACGNVIGSSAPGTLTVESDIAIKTFGSNTSYVIAGCITPPSSIYLAYYYFGYEVLVDGNPWDGSDPVYLWRPEQDISGILLYGSWGGGDYIARYCERIN